jgi:hypothetical protein
MSRRIVAPAGQEEIRYGYTLTAIHHLTTLAAGTAKGRLAMDYGDLLEAAWFGIVEHLQLAQHRPARRDLVEAGQRAVNALVKDEMHHAGYFKYGRNCGYGPGSMPAFVKYWHDPLSSPFESSFLERVTLIQIWPKLTVRQREAFVALADYGDYVLAAEALGIEPQTFRELIGRARRAFLALWHDGEPPSRLWRIDRRVFRRPTNDPAELAERAANAEAKRRARREMALTTRPPSAPAKERL